MTTMIEYDLHHPADHLEALIDTLEDGEQISVVRAGMPVAVIMRADEYNALMVMLGG